MTAVMVS